VGNTQGIKFLCSVFLPGLSLLLIFQSPQDSIRKHYEAAERQKQAGNLAAAEAEYTAILAEAYGGIGKINSARKEYAKATTALEAASLYAPDSQAVLIDLAIAYFDAEQYDKALEAARKVLSRNSQSVGAHHMAGKSYFMVGDFSRSADELEAALKLAPNDYDVAYTLGLAYLKQHQFARAKKLYDRMLEQIGDRPQLHIVFGRAYRETNFLPEAIDEFRRAVRLDPKFPRAHYYLGLTYLLKDGAAKTSEAAEEFKIELAEHPDEFLANYYLGIVYSIERNWDLAQGFLQKASQIQPENPDPYFHLGQVYQALEKHELAIEALQKSIAHNPDLSHNDYQVTTAHYRLSQSLLKAGRRVEGEQELQVAAELKLKSKKRDEEKTQIFVNSSDLHGPNTKFPELQMVEGVVAESNALDNKTKTDLKVGEDYFKKVIASAHNNIGLLRAERQDFRGAAEQFAWAAKWNPQLERINFNTGLAFFKAESYAQATTPLKNELKLNPTDNSVKQLLGLSYFMLEDYAAASPLLSDVVAAKTNDVGVYYALAFSLIKQGMKELADQTIQQMVAFSGNTPQLHILLGQAYYQQNDKVKALEELRAAQALDPKIRLAHYFAGLIYLKLGQLNQAAEEFEAELLVNPNDVQSKYHLGYVLLANQKADRGIKLMKDVIASRPDYADAHYELGKVLLQQGDIKGAVEHLETAIKLQPDRSYVHYQLGRAYLAAGRKSDGESQLEIAKQLKAKERSLTNP
jgi:tetratricopeptide (TPR) repeat protein